MLATTADPVITGAREWHVPVVGILLCPHRQRLADGENLSYMSKI